MNKFWTNYGFDHNVLIYPQRGQNIYGLKNAEHFRKLCPFHWVGERLDRYLDNLKLCIANWGILIHGDFEQNEQFWNDKSHHLEWLE